MPLQSLLLSEANVSSISVRDVQFFIKSIIKNLLQFYLLYLKYSTLLVSANVMLKQSIELAYEKGIPNWLIVLPRGVQFPSNAAVALKYGWHPVKLLKVTLVEQSSQKTFILLSKR